MLNGSRVFPGRVKVPEIAGEGERPRGEGQCALALAGGDGGGGAAAICCTYPVFAVDTSLIIKVLTF